MKVGDLVRWTRPDDEDIGIVTERHPGARGCSIMWALGNCIVFHAAGERYIEVISESR